MRSRLRSISSSSLLVAAVATLGWIAGSACSSSDETSDLDTEASLGPEAAAPDAAPTSADAGAVGDAADAAPDPVCAALCDCLGTTCAAVENYPFPDRAACLAACAPLGPTEKTCFPKWCAKAAAGSSPKHECEHAWGKLGTVECDTL